MVFSARILAGLFFALVSLSLFAAEVAGIKLEERDKVGNSDLQLNGAGLRTRVFFQVYAIGLYLPEKKTSSADAIGAPGAKRIVLHMLRDVDADDFSEALMDGLRANNSEIDMKAFGPSVQQLTGIINELKEARKGMRITLDWLPGRGTGVTFDGRPAGAPIAGEDFYRGLLRIWLGDRPVQDDLKKALLGG